MELGPQFQICCLDTASIKELELNLNSIRVQFHELNSLLDQKNSNSNSTTKPCETGLHADLVGKKLKSGQLGKQPSLSITFPQPQLLLLCVIAFTSTLTFCLFHHRLRHRFLLLRLSLTNRKTAPSALYLPVLNFHELGSSVRKVTTKSSPLLRFLDDCTH